MAHVLNYEEIRNRATDGGCVYEELKHPSAKRDAILKLDWDGIDFSCGSFYLMLMECDEEDCMDYNWNYRCWDEMPTPEEMAAAPWKGNPYE